MKGLSYIMNTYRHALSAAVVTVLLGTTLAAPGLASAGSTAPSGAAQIGSGSTADTGSVYLAVGDSISSGFENGAPHYEGGYVGLVAKALNTKAVNLSCPGETTTSMITGSGRIGGFTCPFTGSQLNAAVSYLKKPGVNAQVITLAIGGNDLTGCVDKDLKVDSGCITTGLGKVGKNLTYILARLRLAEPTATIVVLNYYDPYFAYWLTGTAGKALAVASVPLIGALNGVIATSSAATGSKVANVAGVFKTTVWTPDRTSGLPTNVAMICTHTDMCEKQDNHPNASGYQLIAAAVLATLGR